MPRTRHVEPLTLWGLLFPGSYLSARINLLERHMSEAEDRLNEAIAQVGTDLGEAITRIPSNWSENPRHVGTGELRFGSPPTPSNRRWTSRRWMSRPSSRRAGVPGLGRSSSALVLAV